MAAVRRGPDGELQRYNQYVNPGQTITAGAQRVHHITPQIVRGAPDIGRVLPGFMEFIGEDQIVGYNPRFDIGAISDKLTLTGLAENYPDLRERKLIDLYRIFSRTTPVLSSLPLPSEDPLFSSSSAWWERSIPTYPAPAGQLSFPGMGVGEQLAPANLQQSTVAAHYGQLVTPAHNALADTETTEALFNYLRGSIGPEEMRRLHGPPVRAGYLRPEHFAQTMILPDQETDKLVKWFWPEKGPWPDLGLPEGIEPTEGMDIEELLEWKQRLDVDYKAIAAAEEAPSRFAALGRRAYGFASKHKVLAGGAGLLGLLALRGILFSGRDDNYNTIEGMRHGGWLGEMRPYNTDFGSGFLGQGTINLFRGTTENIAEHAAQGLAAVFKRSDPVALLRQKVERVFEAVRATSYPSRPSRLQSTYWTPSLQEAIGFASQKGGARSTVSRITRDTKSVFFTSQDIYSSAVCAADEGNERAVLDFAHSYWKGITPEEAIELAKSKYGRDIPEVLIPGVVRAEKTWASNNGRLTYDRPALPTVLNTLFSGRDDAYNTIEGLRHSGVAGSNRKKNTDFGSGYQGIWVHGQYINPTIQAFRDQWNGRDEELKEAIGSGGTKYGELAPSQLVKIPGTPRSRVNLAGYQPEWEDADTLLLNAPWWQFWKDPVAIRLVGIDAPEITHPDDELNWLRYHQAQPHGQASLRYVQEATAGQELSIEVASDPAAKTYGRYLGLVSIAGHKNPLNYELVQAGQVAALPFGESGSDIYSRDKLMRAEREASRNEVGIWSLPWFQRYRNVSRSLGGRITFNSLTDLSRLSSNYNLAAMESFLSRPDTLPDEKFTAHYIGRKLIPSYGRFFSGHDDAYNTIEGLKHGGLAGELRRDNTDFGSGWQGLEKAWNYISKLRPKQLISSIAGKESAQFGSAASQPNLVDALRQKLGRNVTVNFEDALSPMEGMANVLASDIVVSSNAPLSEVGHEIGHFATRYKSEAFTKAANIASSYGIYLPPLLAGLLPADKDDNRAFSALTFAALPLAVAMPRILMEAKASKWAIESLKEFGYGGVQAARKTLGAGLASYVGVPALLGGIGAAWRMNKINAARDGRDPVTVGDVLRYKTDALLTVGGAYAGAGKFGFRGGVIGAGIGVGAAALGHIGESLLPEDSFAKAVIGPAITALQGSIGGSIMAISMAKGGKLYKTGQTLATQLARLSKLDPKQFIAHEAEQLGMTFEEAELIGFSNLNMRKQARSLVAIPFGLRKDLKQFDAIMTGEAKGFAGKASHVVEEMLGSPNFIDTLRKYGSINDIPGKEYLEAVWKDIYGGAGSSAVVGAAIGAALYPMTKHTKPINPIPGKDDAYNTIEGLPHGGMAEQGRKKLTDFGSGYDGIRAMAKEIGVDFAELIGSQGFKRALQKGVQQTKLGSGKFGDAFLYTTEYQGRSFQFVKKVAKPVEETEGPLPLNEMLFYHGSDLRREARFLGDLGETPSVPSLYHYEDGSLYMEYMPGQRLQDTTGFHMSLQQKADFEATMRVAEEKGIVNPDICYNHANNVLVSNDRISIIDLGQAHYVHEFPTVKSLMTHTRAMQTGIKNIEREFAPLEELSGPATVKPGTLSRRNVVISPRKKHVHTDPFVSTIAARTDLIGTARDPVINRHPRSGRKHIHTKPFLSTIRARTSLICTAPDLRAAQMRLSESARSGGKGHARYTSSKRAR